jgi:hypothetical protein
MQGASALSPQKMHNTPLTASGYRAHTSTTPIRTVWWGSKVGEPSRPRH